MPVELAAELLRDTWNRVARLRDGEEGKRDGSLRQAAMARDELRRITREVKLGHVNATEGQRLREQVLSNVDQVREASAAIDRATERLEKIELGPKDSDGERPQEWKQEQYADTVLAKYPAAATRHAENQEMEALGGVQKANRVVDGY